MSGQHPPGDGPPEEPGRFADLEGALRDLGANLAWPDPPDLVAGVRRGLEAPPDLAGRVRSRIEPLAPRKTGRQGWRAAAVAAAALLLVGIVALPGPRRAVADLLGLGGVRVTRVPGPLPSPTRPPSPLGETLALGERVTLAQARADLARPVPTPRLPGYQRPDAVWLDKAIPGGAVSLVYRPRPGLPPSGPTGVGLVLTSFPGQVEEEALLKKMASPGTRIQEVRVGDGPGLWIEGEPHFLIYRAPDGSFREERGRLAANTLLWERDGLTYRLEAEVDQAQALRIARSLR